MKNFYLLIISFIFILFVFSLKLNAGDNLLKTEAIERASLIENVSYKIFLDLETTEDTFLCNTEINFDVSDVKKTTFIDFDANKVFKIDLNGDILPSTYFEKNRISLSSLKKHNNLKIEAICNYQRTGVGLHRFIDPLDGNVYLHTQFEPFDAHKVFACFDQPDLKGTFDISVKAPAKWVVVSNGSVVEAPVKTGGEYNSGIWKFNRTKPISTYLAAVIAGAYKSFDDRYNNIDLGLYFRRTMDKYVNYNELFELTKTGLAFFEKQFDIPYPFDKYDQIFVPEFNAGGMENVGAVTYSESYIFRTKVTSARKQGRANTFLHEMSHMWFGDLVTMKWWDDLWLNESFASYMAPYALSMATEYKNAWATFSISTKYAAYVEDQLPTTHPIAADIPDTDATRVTFDSITYNKGAAVLKQLVSMVGEETFLKGINEYLKKYSYSNATLNDFLTELEKASSKDLSKWIKQWIQSDGINRLELKVNIDNCGLNKCYSDVLLTQIKDDSSGILRDHSVSVGLFDFNGSKMVLKDTFKVDISDYSKNLSELANKTVVPVVLLNYDDYDYSKTRLDSYSMENLKEYISLISNPLARISSWNLLWDMTRDAEFTSKDWLSAILNHIDVEVDPYILQTLLSRTLTVITTYSSPENIAIYSKALYDKARASLLEYSNNSDIQLSWFNTFINTSVTDKALNYLKDLSEGTISVEGIKIDEEKRWQIVIYLASQNAVDEKYIDALLNESQNDFAKRDALTAKASLPSYENKLDAWKKILEDKSISYQEMNALIDGFYLPGQDNILKGFVDIYPEAVDYAWKYKTPDEALAITIGLYPSTIIEPYVIDIADKSLSMDLPLEARKEIMKRKSYTEMAIKARQIDR
jgi:aminopeptidase N